MLKHISTNSIGRSNRRGHNHSADRATESARRKAEKLARRLSLPAIDLAQRYSVDEAIEYLRTSRGPFFADIREGRLAVIREGKRVFVPGSEIARRSRLPAEAA